MFFFFAFAKDFNVFAKFLFICWFVRRLRRNVFPQNFNGGVGFCPEETLSTLPGVLRIIYVSG